MKYFKLGNGAWLTLRGCCENVVIAYGRKTWVSNLSRVEALDLAMDIHF
jgi:hypothetical protein